MTSGGIVGIKGYRALEFPHGTREVEAAAKGMAQRGVSFGQRLIQLQRFRRRLLPFGYRVSDGKHLVECANRVAVGETRPGQGVFRILIDCLLEVLGGALQRKRRSSVPQKTAAEYSWWASGFSV